MSAHLKDKSVLITGANGGMGLETTKLLVGDGFSRVVMACRSETKALAARANVLGSTHTGGVELDARGGFDMTDPAKIEAAVDALPAGRPFDVVFLQSGGVVFDDEVQRVTWNGRTVERTVFQNAMGGHVVLAALRRRGLLAADARIVVAGGEGARGIPGLIKKPEFDTPDSFVRYLGGHLPDGAKYVPMDAIGVSKFASALWVRELARRLGPEGKTVVWFTPGLTYGTQGLAAVAPIKRWFLEKVVFGIMGLLGLAQSPRAAARKYADAVEGKVGDNGALLGSPEGRALGKLTDQVPMNAGFSDPSLQAAYWDFVEDVVGPLRATEGDAVGDAAALRDAV